MTRRTSDTDAEEQHRREFRAIFAETGHRTLNALLIVSGGATIAFLSFLGSAFNEGDVASIEPGAAEGFIRAIQSFVASVACCVSAYAFAYLSHAAYYFRHDRAGNALMIFTSILAISCIVTFVCGSYAATQAFGTSIER